MLIDPSVIDAQEVAKNLWLGSNLYDTTGFKYIVCVTDDPPKYRERYGQLTVRMPFEDDDHLPDLVMLHDLVENVVKYSQRGPTLVHCTAGLNRSSMVVALVLIKSGMSPQAAIDHLRSVRSPMVLFNKTFYDYLLSQEAE